MLSGWGGLARPEEEVQNVWGRARGAVFKEW